jgi:hypothetical protein
MKIIEYSLSADRLCLGERIKGGVYRPSAKTIAYSQIRGAIQTSLGFVVHAVGVVDSLEAINHLTIGPKARFADSVRLPIKIMYLEGVRGRIFMIDEDNLSESLNDNIVVYMGGAKTKGIGKCFLRNRKEYEIKEEDFACGFLKTRVPIVVASSFGITVLKERLGYLFVPEDEETGKYVLSYFEGSRIKGPKFLVDGR